MFDPSTFPRAAHRLHRRAFIGANPVVIPEVVAGDVVVGIPPQPIERRLEVVDGAGDRHGARY